MQKEGVFIKYFKLTRSDGVYWQTNKILNLLAELGMTSIERQLRNCYQSKEKVKFGEYYWYLERFKVDNDTNVTFGKFGEDKEVIKRDFSTVSESKFELDAKIDTSNLEFGEIKSDNTNVEKITNRKVLIIGDLHAPFIKKGYLEFCKRIYKKYDCNTVVFIGDIIDNHYSSYHDSDPDGFGGEKELNLAKKQICEFYKAFPKAYVTVGNHDMIPNRKAFSNGLSSLWVKSLKEVLCTPNWDYFEYVIIDDVEYTHGTGRKSKSRAIQDIISNVQGHYHSETYINYFVGKNNKRYFAMQIGCGIEETSYAFAYGKNFAKPHINVGVVLDGRLPIIEYMD